MARRGEMTVLPDLIRFDQTGAGAYHPQPMSHPHNPDNQHTQGTKPPHDITPRRFFEEWLPAFYASAMAGKRTGDPLEVRIRLDGDGGGAWDLKVGGAQLMVSPAAHSETPVSIRQTVADWRAIAVGEPGGIDLTPPRGGPLDLVFVDPALRQIVGTVRGAVRFEVTGFNGRTWALTVKLGDQPEKPQPDATITIDAETYDKLLKRQMQPPEAYFAGKIRLSGDTGLAMQLAMSMMPRFSGEKR